MQLTITERLHLPAVLPQTGDYITLVLQEDINKKIRLTQKELEDWEVKGDTNESGQTQFSWNKDKVVDVEFEFTQPELEFIKKQLAELDRTQKLDGRTMKLYKKFNG